MKDDFINYWQNVMRVRRGSGLYRETLCEVLTEEKDEKFHTFNLEHPLYATFINVGMWDSVEAFDTAVTASYIQPPLEKDGEKFLHITKFEFKIRERIVLIERSSRGGALPDAKVVE